MLNIMFFILKKWGGLIIITNKKRLKKLKDIIKKLQTATLHCVPIKTSNTNNNDK